VLLVKESDLARSKKDMEQTRTELQQEIASLRTAATLANSNGAVDEDLSELRAEVLQLKNDLNAASKRSCLLCLFLMPGNFIFFLGVASLVANEYGLQEQLYTAPFTFTFRSASSLKHEYRYRSQNALQQAKDSLLAATVDDLPNIIQSKDAENRRLKRQLEDCATFFHRVLSLCLSLTALS